MLHQTRRLALLATLLLAFGCDTGIGANSGLVSCYNTASGMVCIQTQDVTGENEDADGDGIADEFVCGDTDKDGDDIPDAHEEDKLSIECGEWVCDETEGGLACRQECDGGVVCEKGCEGVGEEQVCGEPVCTEPEPEPAPECGEWVCHEVEEHLACHKECDGGVVCEKTCEIVEGEEVCGEKVCTESDEPGGDEPKDEEPGDDEPKDEEPGDEDGDGISDDMDCGH